MNSLSDAVSLNNFFILYFKSFFHKNILLTIDGVLKSILLVVKSFNVGFGTIILYTQL